MRGMQWRLGELIVRHSVSRLRPRNFLPAVTIATYYRMVFEAV